MKPIPTKTLDAIAAHLKAGTSTVQAESVKIGLHTNGNALRTALRAHLGEEDYANLMHARRVATNPVQRGFAGPPEPRPRPSDAGLSLVTTTSRTAGWDWRYTEGGGGDRILVLRAPDGVEYTQAQPHEVAHLLRENPLGAHLSPSRLVRWEASEARRLSARAIAEDAKLAAHVEGQKAAEVVTQLPVKPAAKTRRKATPAMKKAITKVMVKRPIKKAAPKQRAKGK